MCHCRSRDLRKVLARNSVWASVGTCFLYTTWRERVDPARAICVRPGAR